MSHLKWSSFGINVFIKRNSNNTADINENYIVLFIDITQR